MRRDRANTGLDLERLADEVDDLAKSERDACRSAVRLILEHCLKLEHSPASLPRGGWEGSILNGRAILEDKLTPSLRRDLKRQLPKLYATARAIAGRALRDHGEATALATLPEDCPYTLDQILDPDWFPQPPPPPSEQHDRHR